MLVVIFILLLLYLHLSMFFILLLFFSLLFDVIPHPSVDYRQGFYTPFYTFSSAHRRVICDTFICSTILFLPRALRPWVGIFYSQAFFTLCSFTNILNLRLSRFPWEPAVLPWSLKGFILIFETQTQPICLFDSQ